MVGRIGFVHSLGQQKKEVEGGKKKNNPCEQCMVSRGDGG